MLVRHFAPGDTGDVAPSVFQPGERQGVGPADHGESRSSYLDRSARPQFAAARDRINAWFARLCSEMQPDVLARLRSADDHQFASGYWELYLHELLVRLGYEVVCEPSLRDGRSIDFLARRGDGSMYLEATVAHSSTDERAADARRNRLYREVNKVSTDQFMLGIEIERAGAGDVPNAGELRRQLEQWLASLDPDTVSLDGDSTEQPPTFRWEAAGWVLSFEAYPMKQRFRGERVHRPLGSFADETSGLIDDETLFRRALERKAPNRYGQLEHPYVVAICEYPFGFGADEWHRKNVLYGRSAIAFGDGHPPREVRQPDGFWRGPGQRPRNTRVAAVLVGLHLAPWHFDDDALAWWDNPFAQRPVPDALVPEAATRHQLVLRQGRGDFVVTQPTMTPKIIFDVKPLSD